MNNTVVSQIVSRDFSKSTLRALAKKGVEIIDVTVIPGEGSMPYANGSRGYSVNDNGTGRVWSFSQVLAAAQAVR
jgi:hypothetical protein